MTAGYGKAADAWWDPARQRAITILRRDVADRYHLRDGAVLDAFLADGWPGTTAAEFSRIMSPGWVPERRRRPVTMWAIVSYWSQKGTFGDPGSDPSCFACGQLAPCESGVPARRWNSALGYLERAHLVDHWAGGLDAPQNIVPLCQSCHRKMPMFGLGEGSAAIRWVMQP